MVRVSVRAATWLRPGHFVTTQAMGHALVLALSRLPLEARRELAEAFYKERGRQSWRLLRDGDVTRVAATVVLPVTELAGELVDDRLVDLLNGAAYA